MPENRLDADERRQLLKLARDTITEHLDAGKVEDAKPSSERLGAEAGAFVSLHKHGQLRGCIGTFVGRRPLVNTIQEMAVSASQKDPRFSPVQTTELTEIELEISVLSPLRQIADPAEIQVGRHGIYITRGFHSGVLLPQVATEYGWDRETFLEHTCLKAGLPTDAWKEPDTQIEVFEAQVFSEKDIE